MFTQGSVQEVQLIKGCEHSQNTSPIYCIALSLVFAVTLLGTCLAFVDPGPVPFPDGQRCYLEWSQRGVLSLVAVSDPSTVTEHCSFFGANRVVMCKIT